MNQDASVTPPAAPTPEQVADYLSARGWELDPHPWRGADVWTASGGKSDQVLLPPQMRYRDDRELLLRALHTVARTEGRDYQELLRIVSQPLVDTQYFHTHPPSPSGTVPLLSGMDAMQGIKDAFTLAAQAVLDHRPRLSQRGRNLKEVEAFLRQVRLGPSTAGSYILSAEVPLTPPPTDVLFSEHSTERVVVRAMHTAMAAAARATEAAERDHGRVEVFDEAVTSGVTARLCESLAKFGGHEHNQEFSVRFEWSPAHPEESNETPARIDRLSFDSGAAKILRRAGERLQAFEYEDTVRLAGRVIGAERQSPQDDGFARVRGRLSARESWGERTVLVRLRPTEYAAALEAHTHGKTFEAEGQLRYSGGRIELVPARVLIAGQQPIGPDV